MPLVQVDLLTQSLNAEGLELAKDSSDASLDHALRVQLVKSDVLGIRNVHLALGEHALHFRSQ